MILTSTRDTACSVSFVEAVHATVPPNGGLFVPRSLPQINNLSAVLERPWQERNALLLNVLIGDEYSRAQLDAVAAEAFDFPVHLVPVDDGTYALELWHGPTLAFKDFGVRFLAGILALEHARANAKQQTTILCATSGDTGAAVARAFWRREHFRVVVLYPSGRVTPLQERQFAALGDNVLALRIEGSFDDCQRIAKECFADTTLRETTHLTSANSLNIARVIAQTLYYFEAVAQLRALSDKRAPLVSVPSGNFGNLLSGLMARAMGLDIPQFVIATNINDTIPHFLETGDYVERPSERTLSNAMDVGAPSNWERISDMFDGDLHAMRRVLKWGVATDEETRQAIKQLRASGYVADPHTAVGYTVLQRHLAQDQIGIVLSTAHRAKFSEVMEEVTGDPLPLPESLREIASRPLRAESIGNDTSLVKARIKSHATSAQR